MTLTATSTPAGVADNSISNATENEPCPICGGHDWCWLLRNDDGAVAVVGCRRQGDDLRIDKSGVEYYFHRLAESPPSSSGKAATPPRRHRHDPGEADLLHEVYSTFLDSLKLGAGHRADLRKRGFSDGHIATLDYKSWPDTVDAKKVAVDAVVAVLKKRAGDHWRDLFLQVPGFYMRELRMNAEPVVMAEFRAALHTGNEAEIAKAEQRVRDNDQVEGTLVGEVADIGGMPCTIVPVRDLKGRIIRLQILTDPPDDKGKYRAFTTPVFEGAGAGMHPHKPLSDGHIETLRVRAVEGVFKADLTTLRTGELCLAYPSASRSTLSEGCGAAVNPEVLVNLVLSDLVEKATNEPSYLYDKNVLAAVAFLGEGPRYRKLLDQLKNAKVALTDFKKAVAKKRAEQAHNERTRKARASGKRLFYRGDHTEIGVALLDSLAEADHTGKLCHESLKWDEGVLHAYSREDGIWRQVTAKEESLAVQGFAGSPVGNKGVLNVNERDVRGAIKLAHQRVHEPGFFESAPTGFAFANGFVEVTSDGLKLRPHQLDDRVRFKFDFDFRDHGAGRFHEFLGQLFINDMDAEERVTFLQQFFGACLLGVAPTLFGKVVILHADGDDGKSKLAEIIEDCFPPEAVCSIAPHRWRDDYHVADLAGKRLNLCGGLPGTTDQSHGFWRRFLVLPFTRTFLPHEQDKLIVRKVLHDRPGIIRWMLQGAVTVLANEGIIDTPPSCHQAKRDWQLDADPVRRFLDARATATVHTGEMESLESLFAQFDPWARSKNHKTMAESTLGNRLAVVMKDWAKHEPARFDGLTDKQRASILRDGRVHTKTGNRYPVRLARVEDDIDAMSDDDLGNVLDINKARAASG